MMWQDGATIECDKQHKAIVQSQRHVRRLRAAVEYILPNFVDQPKQRRIRPFRRFRYARLPCHQRRPSS